MTKENAALSDGARMTSRAASDFQYTASAIFDAQRCGKQRCNCSGGRVTHCVAHDDANPSMSVSEKNGRLLVHCFRCTQKDVIAALQERGLFPRRRSWDIGGARHVRSDGGDGGKRVWWDTKGLSASTLPLYNAPALELDEFEVGAVAIVCEGESDADALIARGHLATGTVTGAGAIPCDDSLRSLLNKAEVVLWPDNDEPGRKHMDRIGARLVALGHPNVRRIVWYGAPDKGGAADWVGTDDELHRLIEEAIPFVAANPHEDHRHITMTRASDIEVAPVRWLWDQRVPLGSFGLIAGREGVGKSTFAYWLVARITRGQLPGAGSGSPSSVIICATEDSWSHTIVPRLMAAGADLDLVYRVDVTTAEGVAGYLTLPKDNEDLEAAVVQVDAALILLDPLLSRLDASLDTHKDSEVRRALEPLAALADRTKASVLGLIHVNKGASTDPLNTLMASRAFAAVPRSVIYFARDPDDESTVLVGMAKNSLGRSDLPAQRLRIEGVKVADHRDGPVMSSQIVFMGEASMTLREALTEPSDPGTRTAVSEAMEWLTDHLQDGEAESVKVKRAASAAGHSENALRRAREKLGVVMIPRGFPRVTWWSLPVESFSRATAGETHTTSTTSTTDGQDESVVSSGASGASGEAPPEGDTTDAEGTHGVLCRGGCGVRLPLIRGTDLCLNCEPVGVAW